MCRSSRLLAILLLCGAAPATLAAAQVYQVPTDIGAAVGATRGITQPLPATPINGRPPLGYGPLKSKRPYADGYLEAPGLGLGLDTVGAVMAPTAPLPPDEPVPAGGPPPDADGPPPPGPYGYGPPPCIQPQIIQVGRGLRHRVPTRVVYGPPACGGR